VLKEVTLKKGDTLSGIADAWNTSVEELADINNIKDINKINTGDVLKLPESDSFEWKTPEWLKRVFTSDSLGSALWESLAPEIKDKEGKTLAAKMGVPLNVRQILDPEQDRTEKDFSERTLNALGTVVERSQTEERIRDKIARGVNPNLIEYFDYETVEGRPGADRRGQYDDVGGAPMGWSDLAGKLSDPYYELKTLLGQATVKTGEDGRPVVTDVYDFEPKTRATGLDKFAEYLSTIRGKGLDPYQQVRNYMGFYGPQEGTGQGGALNIALSNGGRTMNLQQQVQNVAAQGRYGDSMLMHVNPAEVRGLAQVAPITTNPQTGQPEAFLPLLAPLLGSLLGPSVFGALGMGGLAGGALTGTLGSALGSGLAQWAATGDVKKGLLAGLTGYGIGSALQGAGAAATGAETAATQAAELSTQASQGVTDILASQPGMSVSLPNIGKSGSLWPN
jgi:LysM repeat protein